MRIAEIYSSIQGEGILTGTPSVFVRVSGCNLRCSFCDTPFASWRPEGDDLSIPDIVAEVCRTTIPHVVLTGGEPMLFSELIPLCAELRRRRRHITIETAGTLYLPLACDLMSISPKLGNSTPPLSRSPAWHHRHEVTRDQPNVLGQLISEYSYQLKFVVGTREDLPEIDVYIQQFPSIRWDRLMLMPEGTDSTRLTEVESWLRPYCERRGMVFCPRRQIEWFGNVRGT